MQDSSIRIEIIVSSFLHAERQPEANQFEKFFSSHGYSVITCNRTRYSKARDDALFDSQGRLWIGSGIRSDAHALDEINAAYSNVEAASGWNW